MFTRRGLIALGAASVAASASGQDISTAGLRARGYAPGQIGLLAHGDSYLVTSAGVGVPRATGTLISQALAALSIPNYLVQVGWSGQGYIYVAPVSGSPRNLVDDFPVTVVPQIVSGVPKYLCSVTDGNDFATGGQTAAASYAAFQAYCAAAIAAGVPAGHIVVATMGQRNGLAQETITSWNNAVVGDADGIGYRAARRDLDPNIGVLGPYSDTTYYQPDGVHLNTTGLTILAGLFAAQVAAAYP